jgi:porin
LLGDWNGARTHLLNQGIDFQFKYTNEIAYNVTGGIRSEATYAEQSFCAAEHKFSEP